MTFVVLDSELRKQFRRNHYKPFFPPKRGTVPWHGRIYRYVSLTFPTTHYYYRRFEWCMDCEDHSQYIYRWVYIFDQLYHCVPCWCALSYVVWTCKGLHATGRLGKYRFSREIFARFSRANRTKFKSWLNRGEYFTLFLTIRFHTYLI